ncbi:hypothetical protein [Nonomuraea sp. NPDC048901]|uniref:hypothetical protein n=1 Tax=Nonomuraea sp. NPDC048901 TaxID=3155627 RepID=UPI0033DF5FA3
MPTVLRHMDLAHGLYYVMLHMVSALAGTGETAMRFPFVLPAHAVMLLCRHPRAVWSRWIVSATVTCALVAPLALVARTQFAG